MAWPPPGHARPAAGNRLDSAARTPSRAGTAGHLRHNSGLPRALRLDTIGDLPGLEELKGAGFIEGRIPHGLSIPMPSDSEALAEDEDPLDPLDQDDSLPDLDMHEEDGPEEE